MSSQPSMDVRALTDYVADWRSEHGIDGPEPLSEPQLAQFVRDMQNELTNLSLRPQRDAVGQTDPGDAIPWRDDAKVIPYSGNAGDIPCWKLVSAMSAKGEGEVFYISDTPAGRALNDDELLIAVATAAGGADPDVGEKMARRIFDGPVENNVRSNYVVDDVMSLNDFISDRLMREMAAGDVRTATPSALPDKVFVQTELPALLENPRVTAINAIPVESLRQTLEETGSMLEVNKRVAEASAALMEGMRYTAVDHGTEEKPRIVVTAVDTTGFLRDSGARGVSFDAAGAEVQTVALAPAPPGPALSAPSQPAAAGVAVLSITDMDTAAFRDLGRNAELAQVLADAATRIADGEKAPFELADTNGNAVGMYEVLPAVPAAAPAAGTTRLTIDLGQPGMAQDDGAQLAQIVQQAADKVVSAPAAGGNSQVATPDGQAAGVLDVSVAAPQPMMAPARPAPSADNAASLSL